MDINTAAPSTPTATLPPAPKLLTSWKLRYADRRLGIFEYQDGSDKFFSLEWYSGDESELIKSFPSRSKVDAFADGFMTGWDAA